MIKTFLLSMMFPVVVLASQWTKHNVELPPWAEMPVAAVWVVLVGWLVVLTANSLTDNVFKPLR